MDATPALVDVEDVEQGALDGDQPGARSRTLSPSPPHISGSSRPDGYEISSFCFVFVLVATTPPPVLRSFHPHSTHFCPSVHQHFSLEIRDLYSFHQLAIQRLVVAVHHLH